MENQEQVRFPVGGSRQAVHDYLLNHGYKLGRPLGVGSEGNVFEAESIALNKKVAIKIFKKVYPPMTYDTRDTWAGWPLSRTAEKLNLECEWLVA